MSELSKTTILDLEKMGVSVIGDTVCSVPVHLFNMQTNVIIDLLDLRDSNDAESCEEMIRLSVAADIRFGSLAIDDDVLSSVMKALEEVSDEPF